MDAGDKKSAEIFYKRGNLHYEKGDFKTAIWYYDQAIRLDPSNYKYYYNRGLAKACLENYDDAIKDFRKVLEIENFADAHYVLGLGLEYKGMLDDAQKEYIEALKLNPELKDAENHLEICEGKMRDHSRHNAKADSDSCREIVEQAENLEKKGQSDKALSKIEEGLKSKPDNIDLLLFKRIISAKNEALQGKEIVIGYRDLKEIFRRKVIIPIRFAEHAIFKHSSIAKRFKGILLYGPPGCGKTLFIRNLAKEEGLALVEVVLSDVLNLYVGESEKRLTEVFNRAKELAKGGSPVLLFIDEVDALGYSRAVTLEPTESYFAQSLIATFLRLFNEVQDMPNLIIVGATNRPWSVDEALKRSGRLGSSIIYCPPPDLATREEMFRHYSSDILGCETLDFKKLAEITPWFSGDDIRSICLDVFYEVAERYVEQEKTDGTARDEIQLATMNLYKKYIRAKTPQTLCWIRKVAQACSEEKIELSDLDNQLKADIARYFADEFSLKKNEVRRKDIAYVS